MAKKEIAELINSAIIPAVDEIIVQVCRAVACRARLKLIAALAVEKEVAPSRLAATAQMSEPQVCAHLRRLSTSGLICRRHSGTWSFAVAQSPYGESAISGQVSRWLFKLFKSPIKTIANQSVAANSPSKSSPEELLADTVFNAATGFTNLRRLQILRHIKRNGHGDIESLSVALKMSPSAASRHLSKLENRAMVTAERNGAILHFRLPDTWKSPLHKELWSMIASQWEKEKLQS
jgi:DNA-binding transcriptional ArsR family regulator